MPCQFNDLFLPFLHTLVLDRRLRNMVNDKFLIGKCGHKFRNKFQLVREDQYVIGKAKFIQLSDPIHERRFRHKMLVRFTL